MGLLLFAAGCKQGLHFFEKFQEIPTKGAAAVRFFSIGDDLFLVFANHYGDRSKYKTKSVIYKMENKRFVLIQTLVTHGANGVEHFTIDGVHYIAIANHYDAGYKLNSVIYKWSKGKFEEFQDVSTNGASVLKFFTIDEEHYLAFSEYSDGTTNSVDSFVYKWKRGRFMKYQNISTDGARACDSIVIANETFLVHANYFHSQSKHSTESSVYKWSGGHFLKFQSVQTQGAYSAKFFRVDGHVFLAFAHYYTGSKYNMKSPIYKWDGVKFTLFQEIPTQGAILRCTPLRRMVKCSSLLQITLKTVADTQFAQMCTRLLEHSLLFTKICKPSELMEYTPLSTKTKHTLCLLIIAKAIITPIALFTSFSSKSVLYWQIIQS